MLHHTYVVVYILKVCYCHWIKRKSFQHFIWITPTYRLHMTWRYLRNLKQNAPGKFHVFAGKKNDVNLRNWMLILENCGMKAKRRKTDLSNRIINNDTRTHLPLFYDEECCDYLMSRREALVGWEDGIKPGKLAASSSIRKCQIKCVFASRKTPPSYASMCWWLIQMNFSSPTPMSCFLMLPSESQFLVICRIIFLALGEKTIQISNVYRLNLPTSLLHSNLITKVL